MDPQQQRRRLVGTRQDEPGLDGRAVGDGGLNTFQRAGQSSTAGSSRVTEPVARSIRTGCGGASYPARMANNEDPSGATCKALKEPSLVTWLTSPEAKFDPEDRARAVMEGAEEDSLRRRH